MTTDAVSSTALERAESLITEIQDYPEPGVLFRDLTPLLADAEALRTVVLAMTEPFIGQYDVVAGIEARGFLLAGAAATLTNVGLVPIRKTGKLPRPAAAVSYELEYGQAEIEMHGDLPKGTRVLLIDDVLATGGTLTAGVELLEVLGLDCIGATVLMELEGLAGREAMGELPLHSVFHG